jgi:hypothetical protein
MENSSFMFILFNELSGGIDEEALGTANTLIADLANTIRNILSEGIHYGVIRNLNPTIAAYGLLGAVQGILSHYLKKDRPVDRYELKHTIGQLLMKGILLG